MDVVWQDSVGSFLDSTSTGGGSVTSSIGDGATLWSAPGDSGLLPGPNSLLWSSTTGVSGDGNLSLADTTLLAPDATLPAAGLLWAGPGSSTSLWPSNSSASPLWQAVQSSFTQVGAETVPVFASAMNDVSPMLWAPTGSIGQAPVLPLTPSPQLASLTGSGAPAASPFSTFAPQQLLWTSTTDAPAAPSTSLASSLGGPVQSPSGLPTSLGGTH